MNINIKKFFALLFTLMFCFCVFTITAFAQKDPLMPDAPPAGETVRPDNGDIQGDTNKTTISEEPNIENPEQNEPQTNTQEDQNNKDENPQEKPEQGEEPEQEPEQEPESKTPNSKDNSSNNKSSNKAHKPTLKTNVDTQKRRIEAAASQAENATSDPNLLSSQSWDELFTSEEEAESEIEAGAGTVSKAETPNVAGVSWILILGVVLIVLAFCGIGLFIYLQFFNKDKIPARNASQHKTPTEFEDISSDSSRQISKRNHPPVSHDTKIFTNVRSSSIPPKANPNRRRKPAGDKDETAPIPNVSRPDLLSKSQAKPTNRKSDFDWQKFFDEDN